MSIIYNIYNKIKEYILSFFIPGYLSNTELNIIMNNDELKELYSSINLNKMNTEVKIINNTITSVTPIEDIIICLKKEIKSYELGFLLQPEAFNHNNLLKKIQLQTLYDNFKTLKEIKSKCLELS